MTSPGDMLGHIAAGEPTYFLAFTRLGRLNENRVSCAPHEANRTLFCLIGWHVPAEATSRFVGWNS